jgi:Zn-dependent protease
MDALLAVRLDDQQIVTAVAWYFVFVASTVLHEAAHAFAAFKLGDLTAYAGGQVSLNPMPHIAREPIGLVVVPIISLVVSGYPLGWASIPYDPHWAMRWPKRDVLMSLAGPASNFLLAAVGFLGLKIGLAHGVFALPYDRLAYDQILVAAQPGVAEGAAKLLSMLFFLNLLLGVFNLLPLPPLDGSSILPLLLRPENRGKYYEYSGQPMVWMIGMLIAWNTFDRVFDPVFHRALQLLFFT